MAEKIVKKLSAVSSQLSARLSPLGEVEVTES